MANRVAIYARVSTVDQDCTNQTREVRDHCRLRDWPIVAEYIDAGVSGTKESRPELDRLLKDARRRRFDVLVVWRLDRLGRNLRHLILLLEELRALGIDFVSLSEGLDATTPAGRLQVHVLAAIAEFERGRIQERVMAGLARARAQGRRLGRPRLHPVRDNAAVGKTVRQAAAEWGVSKTTAARWLVQGKPSGQSPSNRG